MIANISTYNNVVFFFVSDLKIILYLWLILDNNALHKSGTRLHIGHIRLTHSFIPKEEPPQKSPFRNQYSIKHILIECTKLNHTRKKFYKANSMKELFLKIALKNIINFLKTIGLLLKIETMLPTPSTIKFIQTKSFDIYIYTHIHIRI